MNNRMINFYEGKQNSLEKNKKKDTAEYIYIKKDKNGKKKEMKFVTKFISTIDIPYAKYLLK